MEELVSTEALEREMLEDARRKAERILRGADEEARRISDSVGRRGEEAAAELERGYAERSARYRADAMARLPLEQARLRASYVDARLREALGAFLAALPEARVAGMARARLAAARDYLDGKELRIRRRSLSEAAARRAVASALPGARISACLEDPGLGAAGLVAEAADGSAILRATVDLAAELLLLERRGELAEALCAEALGAGALQGDDRRTGASES